MRMTNENERILENFGKNKRTRICPFLPIFGQKMGKNGRTKLNPGETGQNRKFCRILIRDRHALVVTYSIIPFQNNFVFIIEWKSECLTIITIIFWRFSFLAVTNVELKQFTDYGGRSSVSLFINNYCLENSLRLIGISNHIFFFEPKGLLNDVPCQTALLCLITHFPPKATGPKLSSGVRIEGCQVFFKAFRCQAKTF